MNIVRQTTVPHVGLWEPVGIWPGRRQSPQLILCGPGTESPPGITDTSWPPNQSGTLSSLASVVSKSGPKTRMSSRYTKHSDQAIPRSTRSISLSNVARSFTKGHYPKFIEPPLRDEGRFFSVRGVRLHLPVSTTQVEATEKPCTAEGVEAVLNVWEWVGVYLRNLIELSIVGTKPRRSILLFHQDGRTAPRTVTLG